MKLNETSKLYAYVKSLKGYIVAPVRECDTMKTTQGNRNTVRVISEKRRTVAEYVNSQTVLSLLGYAHRDGYKIVQDKAALKAFIAYVKTNNIALIDAVKHSTKTDDDTLTEFTELAVKGFALWYDGIKVDRAGTPRDTAAMPYMKEVEG